MNELTQMVRKYADGGAVEHQGLDLSRVSPEQLRLLQQQDPGALQRGIARNMGVKAAVPPTEAPSTDLQAMLARYAPPVDDAYAGELKAAREHAAKQSEAFQQLLERSMSQSEAKPDKSEMYFRLAAAFGAPTKTGHFTENAAMASEVMADTKKAERAAATADAARRQQLGLSVAQARMQAAQGDVTALRQLAAEEMKDKRAWAQTTLKEYLASGKPQSEAGKIAMDSGLKPGTPEYSKFVNDYVQQKLESGDMYKTIMAGVAQQGLELRKQTEQRQAEAAKRLTPQEMKLKTDTEDVMAQTDQAMQNLQRAFQLNPNTFDASMLDTVQRKALEAVGSKDPKVVATRELENLLEKAALSSLKSTFPGAISNDERKALQDVQGLGAKSIEERGKIMKSAYKALNTVKKRHAARLAEIEAGKYRTTEPQPAEVPEELE